MTRLELTPEGVGSNVDVSILDEFKHGRTYADVRGGHRYTESDGTYQNMEGDE